MKSVKSKLSLLLVLVFAICTFASGGQMAFATGDPGNMDTEDIIYMVMTDRYYDGDNTNNGTEDEEYRPGDLHYYQGGDWDGLISKLDYIKDLGFTAIWISPPQDNEDYSRSGDESGYHGYFTHDFNTVDEHFGTSTDLQDLLDEAHERGIKVIIDAQLNHTADYLADQATQYSPLDYCPAYPFNDPDWYHHYPNISDWDDEFQLHNYSLGGLDDLKQEDTDCWNAILSSYEDWIGMGFDAARIDAVMEIPESYVQDFEEEMGIPSFGEAFSSSVDTVSSFQDYQWGILDFPLYFAINETFAKGNSFSNIKNVFDQDYKYNDINKVITFVDNHDRQRFLANAYDNYAKLRLAMAFIYATRGVPDVYYGTEQAEAADYKASDAMQNAINRDMMPSFSTSSTMYKWVKRLNEIRKDYSSALCKGKQREMWYGSTDSVFAFSRRNDSLGDEVVGIFNNSCTQQTRTIPLRAESSWTLGTRLTNLLDTSEVITVTEGATQGSRQISVTLSPYEALMLTNGYPAAFAPPSYTQTRIYIHYDAGYGNTLYVRGNTDPLNWSWGQKAVNINSNTWEFVMERIPANNTVEFKVLINDSTWSTGNNFTVTGGSYTDVYPSF